MAAKPAIATIPATQATSKVGPESSKDSHQRRFRAVGNEIEVDGFRIRRSQIQMVLDKPEVKSVLARYGLN
jgi:hypothetical protein